MSLPKSWYSVPGVLSGGRSLQLTKFLVHRYTIVVLEEKGEKPRLAWVRTNRFLHVAGSIVYQLAKLVPNEEVYPVLNDFQKIVVMDDRIPEYSEYLVAVMPFTRDMFDEFISLMRKGTGAIQSIFKRCQLMDALCVADSCFRVSRLVTCLRQSMSDMIDVRHVDEDSDDSDDDMSEAWDFRLRPADPSCEPGHFWLSQTLQSLKQNSSFRRNYEKDITTCASDEWFRNLVSIDVVGSGGVTDEPRVYNYVDILAIESECRALIDIMRFLSLYDYKHDLLMILKHMCRNPVLAHTLLIDPKQTSDLIKQGGLTNPDPIAMMFKQCARTEINNYTRLDLPLSAPVWLSLDILSKLAPLSFRTPEHAHRLLKEFVGEYLDDLDLSETIITGSAIAVATIITGQEWKTRVRVGPDLSERLSLSLYPCIHTIPDSKEDYKTIFSAFKSTSSSRKESHKIINLTTPADTKPLTFQWQWSQPIQNPSLKKSISWAQFYNEKDTTEHNKEDESEDKCKKSKKCRNRKTKPRSRPPPTCHDAITATPISTTAVHDHDLKIYFPPRKTSDDDDDDHDTIDVATERLFKLSNTPNQDTRSFSKTAATTSPIGSTAITQFGANGQNKTNNHVTAAIAPTIASTAIIEFDANGQNKTHNQTDNKTPQKENKIDSGGKEVLEGGMVRLDAGETLQSYLDPVKMTWTYIDGNSRVLSCKFSLQVGADVQLMVLTNDPTHLERVAFQHFARIRGRHPGVKLVRLQQNRLEHSLVWYAVVDPTNLSRFRMVTIYSGSYRDLLLSPVGMTRAGYTKHADHKAFFGSASYAFSGTKSTSINFLYDDMSWSKEPKHVHEFLLKYKMRGFGWPHTISHGDGDSALSALREWAKEQPRWSRIAAAKTGQALESLPPFISGDAQFNIATFLDLLHYDP